MSEILLDVKDAKKYFNITSGFGLFKRQGSVKAVDSVSFTVNKGDVFGLVGESGCGKTTTLKLILLLEELTSGSIIFKGKDIARLDREGLRSYRRSVQAMFQDPYSSLDPRMRIGNSIAEPIEINLPLGKKDIKKRVAEILDAVKLPPDCGKLFPHQFSGGQRQRIALARSIAINPDLIVLDEPVSALDVSIRAQLMNLLMDIQKKMGLTYIMIAHDLATVRYMCNRMAVMYLGKIVEYGDSEKIFSRCLHPYVRMLFSAALPSQPGKWSQRPKISGEVPNPINPPSGCRFHPRCSYRRTVCNKEEPQLEIAENGHQVACHIWKEISEFNTANTNL